MSTNIDKKFWYYIRGRTIHISDREMYIPNTNEISKSIMRIFSTSDANKTHLYYKNYELLYESRKAGHDKFYIVLINKEFKKTCTRFTYRNTEEFKFIKVKSEFYLKLRISPITSVYDFYEN